MSEPTVGDMRMRVAPKRREARLDALTILVRVPGDPTATAAFTASEEAEAQRYADEYAADGAMVVPLPASIPDTMWDWETRSWIGRNAE